MVGLRVNRGHGAVTSSPGLRALPMGRPLPALSTAVKTRDQEDCHTPPKFLILRTASDNFGLREHEFKAHAKLPGRLLKKIPPLKDSTQEPNIVKIPPKVPTNIVKPLHLEQKGYALSLNRKSKRLSSIANHDNSSDKTDVKLRGRRIVIDSPQDQSERQRQLYFDTQSKRRGVRLPPVSPEKSVLYRFRKNTKSKSYEESKNKSNDAQTSNDSFHKDRVNNMKRIYFLMQGIEFKDPDDLLESSGFEMVELVNENQNKSETISTEEAEQKLEKNDDDVDGNNQTTGGAGDDASDAGVAADIEDNGSNADDNENKTQSGKRVRFDPNDKLKTFEKSRPLQRRKKLTKKKIPQCQLVPYVSLPSLEAVKTAKFSYGKNSAGQYSSMYTVSKSNERVDSKISDHNSYNRFARKKKKRVPGENKKIILPDIPPGKGILKDKNNPNKENLHMHEPSIDFHDSGTSSELSSDF